MTKQKKNTILFSAFLLLGGLLHVSDPEYHYFLNTVFFCAEYLIYAGLILFWGQSVNERLLPGREKAYLTAASAFMLLILAAQAVKYRIAVLPWLTRYCWYVYYIPYLMIPTLFLMTCLCFMHGEKRRFLDERLLLIPAVVLALGILTNDLHMMAFLPAGNIKDLTGGSAIPYTHGFLFYTAYAWIGFTMTAGIIVLLTACRKSSFRKAFRPLFFLILMPILIVVINRLPKEARLYEDVEIILFCMLGVFEACIRNRLIPENENYPGFFAQMDLPVLITDRQLNPVFRTHSSVPAEKEQLAQSLQAPVYLTADSRLSGMEVLAGYAFRAEDESFLHRLNEELRDANEVLSQENKLLEREQKLTDEQKEIGERLRIYQKAAKAVYPVQKRISTILEKMRPRETSFRQDITRVLVLMAYVKRMANFSLVEEERRFVSAKELASALEESAHYLRYCGMNTVVNITAERTFPCRQAMAIYESFEAAAEKLLGMAEDAFIRLQDHELMMMAEIGEKQPDLSGLDTPLPSDKAIEDGYLVLRFSLEAERDIGTRGQSPCPAGAFSRGKRTVPLSGSGKEVSQA